MSATIRVDSEIKEQVTPILSQLGMSVSEAVNIFLHQVKIHGGIPFDINTRRPYLGSPEFFADVEEAHAEYANGTGESYKTMAEFIKAVDEL